MKKIIALLLLVALTLTVLAACNNVGDDTSKEAGSKADESEAVVDKDAAWKDENGNYVPKVKKDMQGATFTIVVRGDKYGTYRSDDFFVAEDSIYGDRLRNAVNKRNERVKQDYNVELNLIRSDDIYNEVTNDIDSGLAEYDAIMPTMRNLATLASDNKLLDLTEINGLDINAPWYDKNVTEAFSIKGCVYFTAGDITILNKVNCCSILFSKEIIANNTALENPYDLVKSNQWTYDKLVEMGKAVANTNSTDLNQRTYGMLGHANDVYSIFVGCSNEPIVIKDDDDLPVINFDNSNERAVKNTQKVLDSYVNGSDWIIYSNNTEFGTGAAMWDNSLAYFGNGHALFRPSYFSATTKLRQRSEKLFGIVPVPKLEEYQDDYYTYCTTGETAGIAIPITAKDPEFSAYMIDVYSAWAKNYITPAYVDVNLYQLDARDDDSEAMLDIIFTNIIYDMGECFNFGNIPNKISTLCSNGSTDVVSTLAEVQTQMLTDIDKLREQYED